MVTLRYPFFLLIVLSLLSGFSPAAHDHDDVPPFPPWHDGQHLGRMSMSVTTSSEAANKHFQMGIKLLHTYAFQEALWSLREAQRLDPGFAMTYWGEIIAGNKLIWNSVDPERVQSAIQRMDQNVDYKRLTPLEAGYIKAARLLASPNPKKFQPWESGSPNAQFRLAMADLYRQFPDDPDVKVIYGYSILGTRRGVRDFPTNHEAVMLFRDVLAKNPEHPGALHYLIHGTENPVQSYLAKSAAESFTEIAADSIHAWHMPTHYYITLGDWPKVVDINQKAMDASIERAKDQGLDETSLEYHGYSWVIYGLLQQGKEDKAFQGVKRIENLFRKTNSITVQKYLLLSRARFLVDSDGQSQENQAARTMVISHKNAPNSAVVMDIFASGYNNWKQQDAEQMAQDLARYQTLMNSDLSDLSPAEHDAVAIMEQQLLAMAQMAKGDYRKAEDHFNRAVRLEAAMVHEHGPPINIKPASELYADVLLAQKRFGEALYFYDKANTYYPGRRQIVLGRAKAMEQLKDPKS